MWEGLSHHTITTPKGLGSSRDQGCLVHMLVCLTLPNCILVKCGRGAATSQVLNSCMFPKQGWGRQLREAPEWGTGLQCDLYM